MFDCKVNSFNTSVYLISIKLINSIIFIDYMATTISISKKTKEKLKNLGRTGDSYEDVIKKMYEISKKQILLDYLHDKSNSTPIADALKEAEKRINHNHKGKSLMK